jgi:caa(3)-type oxidase subunit IV
MSHAAEFDEYGHKDHGHVIVSLATLRLVLGALLFFTLLTVGAAWLEGWIASTFAVEIPQAINVLVAISIAAVKTVLVVMIFMQLKYDNPMNTAIFVFTVLTAAFFLGFTALDLGSRSTLDLRKAQYVVEGGTGLQAGGPIVVTEREKAIADGHFDPSHAHPIHREPQDITSAGYLPEKPVWGSSRNLSRPRQGVTIPGLPGYRPPAGAHAGHAARGNEHVPAGAEPTGEKAGPSSTGGSGSH